MRSFSGSRWFLLLIVVLIRGLGACAENEPETVLNTKENAVMLEGTSPPRSKIGDTPQQASPGNGI